MIRIPLLSLRSAPFLFAALVAVACSTTPKNNLLGGSGGNGGDDETVSAGSGSPTGCAGLAACCASIADATTRMSCTSSEQTYAGIANGDQDCSVLLTQYQSAKVCGGGSTTGTTGTTGAGGGSGSGCAALSACCAMMSDASEKQSCLMSEAELAMSANGDAACAQAAASYAAANLCMAQVTGSSTGSNTTGSSTTSGVGGMNAASSSQAATTDAASSTGSGGNIIPSTCDQAHGMTGCCAPNGAVFYCAAGASQPSVQTCAAPEVCGWNVAKSYYGCVAAPGGVDPDPSFPYNCGP